MIGVFLPESVAFYFYTEDNFDIIPDNVFVCAIGQNKSFNNPRNYIDNNKSLLFIKIT